MTIHFKDPKNGRAGRVHLKPHASKREVKKALLNMGYVVY